MLQNLGVAGPSTLLAYSVRFCGCREPLRTFAIGAGAVESLPSLLELRRDLFGKGAHLAEQVVQVFRLERTERILQACLSV